jgi:hypothetical protein
MVGRVTPYAPETGKRRARTARPTPTRAGSREGDFHARGA